MTDTERLTLTRRPEYTLKNMGRVVTVLQDFGIEVSPQDRYEFDQLFCGIDFADQLTDNPWVLPEGSNHILFFLTGKRDLLPPEIPKNAVENFSFLRKMVSERGIGPHLEEVVDKLLSLRDQLFTANTIPDYIKLTREEAGISAELAFLFLPKEIPVKVKKFLIQANILGNLTDNLLDLESDFAQGQISLRPSRGLKNSLKIEIVKQVAVLGLRYPRKKRLVGLAKKYIGYVVSIPSHE